MEIMSQQAADISAIGKRLESARERSGMSARDVMLKIDADANTATWYRWIHGKREGGVTAIVKAGLVLGIRPDALLLKEEGDAVFTDEDLIGLDQLREMLWELTQRGDKWLQRRPVAILVDQLRSVMESLPPAVGVRIPAGTVIRRDRTEHGRPIKAYTAPKTYTETPETLNDSADSGAGAAETPPEDNFRRAEVLDDLAERAALAGEVETSRICRTAATSLRALERPRPAKGAVPSPGRRPPSNATVSALPPVPERPKRKRNPDNATP